MKVRLVCEFCKNQSGKTDTWGGCISCGAPLTEIVVREIETSHPPAPYIGVSGSVVYPPSVVREILLTKEEQINMIRRSVGL